MEGLTYGITLTDHLSGPAKQASGSLKDMARDLLQTKQALSDYQSQLTLSKQTGDVGGYRKYTGLIDEERRKLFNLSEGLGGASKAKGILAQESKSLAATDVESTAALGEMTGGLTLVAGAALAAATAIATLTFEGAKLAIQATQDKIAMVDAFGGGEIGSKTEESLSDLAHSTGIAKDDVQKLGATFHIMGVEGDDALRKITLAGLSARAITRATGQDGAAALEALTKKIQVASEAGHGLQLPGKALAVIAETGADATDVAKRMGLTFGQLSAGLKAGTINADKFGDALQDSLIDKGAGPLTHMSNELGNVWKNFGSTFKDLFEDMSKAIDPFIAQVRDLFSIFDSKTTNSGKALKSGIGGAFTFIFGVATKAILPIKHFFQDVIIWSLRSYIFLKEHWTTVQTILNGVSFAAGIVVGVFKGLAGIALVAAAAIGLIAAAGLWVTGELSKLGSEALDFGTSLVDGLVNGIEGGISRVVEAAKNLGEAAKNSLKDFLGIHSPSRVMMQLGGYTSEGFAGGIEAGAGHVEAASAQVSMGAMRGVRPGDYAGVATSYNAPQQASGGKSVTIGDVVITIQAPQGVTNAEALTENALATVFERLALQIGAAA